MKNFIRRLFISCIITSSTLLAYCLYEPHTLEITHYTLNIPELSDIKIIFAADFHIAPNETKRLKKIISTINQEHPDIIILGGDYVNGHKQSSSMPINAIAKNFATFEAPFGIYAVLGNHDNWYGKNDIITALQKHNIRVLDNQNHQLKINNTPLTIIGISDLTTDKPDFIKAFQNASAPAILITHSPDTFPESPKTALTLAAHTHGGQIRLPFIGAPIVNSAYGQRYNNGLISENDKTMIVTKGLGTSLFPIRFNCRPEIVVITFQ